MADEPDLIIDWLGGNCPVQAEGTLDGIPFYFRARGERWTFEVGANVWEPDWRCTGLYGDGPFAAGWMSEDEARERIAFAVKLWQASKHVTKEVFAHGP